MWSNYHAHSVYCDGKSDLTSIIKQSNVLMSLGFSSHAPLPFDCGWCMKYEKLPDYLSSIEKLKSSTRLPVIDKGLEVDFIPGIIKPADFNDALDYTIGSIHFVESFPDGNRWEIDGQHQLFLERFERIFHAIGFRKLSVLKEGKWQPVQFNEHGLITQ